MVREHYQLIIQQADKPGVIEKGFNSITFFNVGVANLLIAQGLPIPTNGTFVVQGEENEVCDSEITYSFTTAGTRNAYIVRKVFTNNK